MTTRAPILLLACAMLCPGIARAHAATSNTVLFDREIVRLLNEHCVACHAEGGASFPLETYEQTFVRRDAIHAQILARHMPPWAAVPGYHAFVNANDLTLREKRFVVSWVEGLAPRNDGEVFLNVLAPGAAPAEIRANVGTGTWRLGDPDVALALPEIRPAAGAAEAIVPLELESERHLAGIEYRPAQRHALRAVVFSLESTGQWLATWTPWHGMRQLPDGVAYPLAPGSRIVARPLTHEPDPEFVVAGELGLHFADHETPSSPSDIVLTASDPAPEGVASGRLESELVLDRPVEILAVWPELPAGLIALEISAHLPDGRVDVLLLALDIPAEWPTSYLYEAPVELPAGTRLRLSARIANDGRTAAGPELRVTLSAVGER